MDEIQKEILERIKNKEIKPKPRWYFSLKNNAFWGAFVASIVVGSVAFAVMLFSLADNDWTIYTRLHKSFVEYFIASIPYFWIAWIVLFILISYAEFRHTKRGYRFMTHLVVGGSVVLSMVLGTGLFFLGLGGETHELLIENIPYYRSFVFDKRGTWSQPNLGLLSGTIRTVQSNNQFMLEDWEGRIWQVQAEDSTWHLPFAPETMETVRIIGEKSDDNYFRADEIREWNRGMGRRRIPPPHPSIIFTTSTKR